MLTLSTLRQIATSVGFDDIGIAQPERLEEDESHLKQWLENGNNGSMQYMEENLELRVDPLKLYPYCKTIVVCLINYYKSEQQVENAPYIAKSGLSKTDYHIVVKTRLNALEKAIEEMEEYQGIEENHLKMQHLFCDSAPVLERRWAVKAGLGVIGKNHLFISERFGSFVHIGIMMLPIHIADDTEQKATASPCLNCSQCIKACPTGALREDMFDARKCLSYLTIERKEELDDKYKLIASKHLYGCDRCQLVCPMNADLSTTECNELQADERMLKMSQEEWATMSRRQKLKLLHRLAK